jgi:hypothetical protein
LLSPSADNLKAGRWRLATDVSAKTSHLQSYLQAVERLPSEGRGKPIRLIAIRFVSTNKLSKDAKLLLAFDALVLSEMLGQEVSLGKVIHGDKHTTLNVRVSALAFEVRQHIAKIAALLSSPSPPNLVLIPHCAERLQSRDQRVQSADRNDSSTGVSCRGPDRDSREKGRDLEVQLKTSSNFWAMVSW